MSETGNGYITKWLSKQNPRIPIVIATDEGARVLGFLRFTAREGNIRFGRGERSETVKGTVCGIELAIRKDAWKTYQKAKIQKGENYYHFRVAMLTPDQLMLLGARLMQMAQMLQIKNTLTYVKAGPAEEKEGAPEVEEEEELDIERE